MLRAELRVERGSDGFFMSFCRICCSFVMDETAALIPNTSPRDLYVSELWPAPALMMLTVDDDDGPAAEKVLPALTWPWGPWGL